MESAIVDEHVRNAWTTGCAATLVLSAAVGCGGGTGAGGGAGTSNAHEGTEGSLRPLEVRVEEMDAESLDALARQESELVAQDVARRRAARHHRLPPVERTQGEQSDAWPIVTVRNNTPHGLVVWFAGPCARAVALAAQATQAVEICEGHYDIAAQLASPDFVPFVGDGDEVENGSRYRLTFYVLVAPHTRSRRR